MSALRFPPFPRLVIFIAEGAMPYRARWEEMPGALRAVLGLELPDGITAEVERVLSLAMLPTIVVLDDMLEVHTARTEDADVPRAKDGDFCPVAADSAPSVSNQRRRTPGRRTRSR